GAVALYAERGYRVRVLCLSYGERGESAKLWKQGASLEVIKDVRRGEAERAGEALGAELRFFDAGDYPLRTTDSLMDSLVRELRDVQPQFVLTHSPSAPYTRTAPVPSWGPLQCGCLAQAHGYPPEGPVPGAPP